MAFDLYNFPYSRVYDGDLGYLIKVYNELLTAYKNANLDYTEIQNQLDTVKANLEEQITKEDKDYKELLNKIEIIEAYLGTGTGSLQETLTKIQNDIVTINNTLTAYDTRITNNTNAISKNANDISALQTKTDTTNSDLAKLTGRVSANESAITENTRDIAKVNAEIETTNARIDNLEDTLIIKTITTTPFVSGTQYTNLNFETYIIGNTLHFNLSSSSEITNEMLKTENSVGLEYGMYLKIAEIDFTDLNTGSLLVQPFGSAIILDDNTKELLHASTLDVVVTDAGEGAIADIGIAISQPIFANIVDKTVDIICSGSSFFPQ